MRKLYEFLVKYKIFFLFILLEFVCFWLIFNRNNYQGAVYFSTSNRVVGNLIAFSNNIQYYFSLNTVNKELAAENAKLKQRISNIEYNMEPPGINQLDSSMIKNYKVTPAKVINNAVRMSHNYITINKGSKHGIERGQGVLSENSIAGRVKYTSKNFATITSVLHTDLMISSKLKHSKVFGTVKWDGNDPQTAKLLYIPRHIKINKGDTILTSGYNSVFNANEMIGVIEDYDLQSNENFYNINVALATDFNRLNYVYVIKQKLKQEKDSLEQKTRINQ